MTTQPFQVILFDFDGTLADSYPAITASVNHVRAGRGLPPLTEAEVRRQVGRGAEYLLIHTVPGTDLSVDLPRYREHHPTVMRSGTRLLPGAAEAVAALKAAGLRLAVCSNKPVAYTRDLIAYLGLGNQFNAILGPEDVAQPKPAPDMLLAALTQLGVAAAAALYVGDMGLDVETARAAGVAVWVVATGSDSRAHLEAAHPDRILRDLDELAELLQATLGN